MQRIALAILLALTIAACQDLCTGVVCGPAPRPLEVIVFDTVLVDTTVRVIVADTASPTGIDTVDRDTTLGFIRPTVDAVVTLHRVSGTDTTTFLTLAADGDRFAESDAAKLEGADFFIRATRGTRSVQTGSVRLSRVEGCCPYSVVGLYRPRLPIQ